MTYKSYNVSCQIYQSQAIKLVTSLATALKSKENKPALDVERKVMFVVIVHQTPTLVAVVLALLVSVAVKSATCPETVPITVEHNLAVAVVLENVTSAVVPATLLATATKAVAAVDMKVAILAVVEDILAAVADTAKVVAPALNVSPVVVMVT